MFEESQELVREFYTLGDTIFHEGETGYHFYIIEKGQVEIYRKDGNARLIPIARLAEGEAFGEFALIAKKSRSASARATTDTTLIKVSQKGYEELLEQLPEWAQSMMQAMIDRLKSMNDILKDHHQFISKK